MNPLRGFFTNLLQFVTIMKPLRGKSEPNIMYRNVRRTFIIVIIIFQKYLPNPVWGCIIQYYYELILFDETMYLSNLS